MTRDQYAYPPHKKSNLTPLLWDDGRRPVAGRKLMGAAPPNHGRCGASLGGSKTHKT